MEALEAGAIPVTVSLHGVDYFRFIFGDHPFATADSWERAADAVAEMMSDDATLAKKGSRFLNGTGIPNRDEARTFCPFSAALRIPSRPNNSGTKGQLALVSQCNQFFGDTSRGRDSDDKH